MLGENCPVATPTKEDSSMPLNELSDTPRESVAPVQPESSVEKTESQQSSPTRGEPRERDSSLTGEGGPALILIQVEAQSLTMRVGLNWSLQLGQMSVGEPPDLPSRGDLSVAQGAQVNQEQDSRRPGAVLPSKGDQNKHEPTSNEFTSKEQSYMLWVKLYVI